MVVRRTRSGRWLVLEIAGEMDLQVGPLLYDVGNDPCYVVFDLHRVTFMDCSSLRALQYVQRRALAADGSMRLAAMSVQVQRILALTRTDRAFPQFETVRDATSFRVTRGRDPVTRGTIPRDEVPAVTIEEAKGTLAQIHGISPEAAFTLMRVYSSSHRRDVGEIARLVVDDPMAIPEVTAWIKLSP